jgi:hypothetical protein
MWLVLEAYTLIIRKDILEQKFPWLIEIFKNLNFHFLFSEDDYLIKLSLYNWEDLDYWENILTKNGLIYLNENKKCQDFCIWDLNDWPEYECDWLKKFNLRISWKDLRYPIVKHINQENDLEFTLPEGYEERFKNITHAKSSEYEIISEENWVQKIKNKLTWEIWYLNVSNS